jgi:hypothetical protein
VKAEDVTDTLTIGRGPTIILERERIKRETIMQWRLLRGRAAA